MAESYKLDSVVQTGRTKQLAQFFTQKIKALDAESALRGVTYQGNTIKFFTTTDTTKTAAFSFDLPAERYLDQTQTKIENNFAFDATKYAGATNPNLDGKPVLVFAVKSQEGLSDTINYSFLDMSAFMTQDISGKVDKVTGATAGNIATFVAGGNISDTGIAFATEAEFTAMLNEVFPAGGGA